jgi:hypothetical protein
MEFYDDSSDSCNPDVVLAAKRCDRRIDDTDIIVEYGIGSNAVWGWSTFKFGIYKHSISEHKCNGNIGNSLTGITEQHAILLACQGSQWWRRKQLVVTELYDDCSSAVVPHTRITAKRCDRRIDDTDIIVEYGIGSNAVWGW